RNGRGMGPITKGTVRIELGDKVRVVTGGGGGFGDPLKREPARVERDVRFGYGSPEAARAAYGVVLDERSPTPEAERRQSRMTRTWPAAPKASGAAGTGDGEDLA